MSSMDEVKHTPGDNVLSVTQDYHSPLFSYYNIILLPQQMYLCKQFNPSMQRYFVFNSLESIFSGD